LVSKLQTLARAGTLKEMSAPYDVICIGAGPTGLACAIEAKRAGLRPLVIDKGVLCNSLYHYPVNMVFFTTPELLEIGDLPFVSAAEKPARGEALKYYRKCAEHYDLELRLGETVTRVEGGDGDFRVHTRITEINHAVKTGGGAESVHPIRSGFRTPVDSTGLPKPEMDVPSEQRESRDLSVPTQSDRGISPKPSQFHENLYRSRKLIVATGYYDLPNRLGVPGEELPHVSHYYTEPHPFWRQDVVVVGGKNSAAEAALDLYRSGARVTLVHRRAELGSTIKYWVRPDIENRIKAGQISALFEHHVVRIEPGAVHLVGPPEKGASSRESPRRESHLRRERHGLSLIHI